MPIKIQKRPPAKGILENENIFVMDEGRAISQEIRPLKICILNLMPLKEETELQLLRALSNTPLQVDVDFMKTSTHVSQNTSANHLNRFYSTFAELKDNKYDGLIITGAPVEQMAFGRSGLLGRALHDHGMVQEACHVHAAYLLGRTGGTVLSFRTAKDPASGKAVWYF